MHADVTKIARRMSRVSMDCLKWNKRSVNQAFETMGLRSAIMSARGVGDHGCDGSPEADRFDAIRRSDGLAAALKWRAEQFAPYE